MSRDPFGWTIMRFVTYATYNENSLDVVPSGVSPYRWSAMVSQYRRHGADALMWPNQDEEY